MTTQLASAPAPDRIPFADCHIVAGSRRAAHRVLESGWVTTGPEVAAFEAEFAAYVGAAHAIAVSSCTAALELSLRYLRLPEGAPVLVSDLTFCGAVQAIVHAGLRPVLVDVSPVTGMPTPETTHAAHIRCGGAEAMVVVHWAGDPADVAALAAAADLPLDRVVEDAAHAVGTALGDRRVGDGAAVCFSFYATKNLPIGEGGMITTDDPERAELAAPGAAARHVGRRVASLPARRGLEVRRPRGRHEGQHDRRAGRHRPRPARAAPRWQELRAHHAARYDRWLADLPGLALPHRPEPGQGVHAWHLYPVRVVDPERSRDEVMAALDAAGVGTSLHFIPIHHLEYFGRVADVPPEGLPGAETIFGQLISLPLYPRLRDAQTHRVADALADALGAPAGVTGSAHRGRARSRGPGPVRDERLAQHLRRAHRAAHPDRGGRRGRARAVPGPAAGQLVRAGPGGLPRRRTGRGPDRRGVPAVPGLAGGPGPGAGLARGGRGGHRDPLPAPRPGARARPAGRRPRRHAPPPSAVPGRPPARDRRHGHARAPDRLAHRPVRDARRPARRGARCSPASACSSRAPAAPSAASCAARSGGSDPSSW